MQQERAIRNAATVIIVRDGVNDPKILMGQRGKNAAFMPSKFVFPGGAVDSADSTVQLWSPLTDTCAERLLADSMPGVAQTTPDALAVAAIREVFEETGQTFGVAAAWDAPPDDWRAFAALGLRPDASGLRFVFRAVTPPGRPRRFDARFFLADAAALSSDLDDFSAASGELSSLQWVPLREIRSFDLPFVTEIVLAEVAAHLRSNGSIASVPFIRNTETESEIRRIS